MQSSSLILKHSDISPSATLVTASSAAGYWSNGKQETTWNVDLRQVIGPEIFDKHKRFVLRLNMMAHNGRNFPLAANDQCQVVQISGLSWVNSSYNQLTQTNGSTYDAFLLYMDANIGKTYYLNHNVSKAIFQVSAPVVQITIRLLRQIDNAPAQYAAETFPSCCYSFDIFPVEE